MDCVPVEREFRYVKTKDEITTLSRTAKDIRSLYSSSGGAGDFADVA